jgi:hypothetical protein
MMRSMSAALQRTTLLLLMAAIACPNGNCQKKGGASSTSTPSAASASPATSTASPSSAPTEVEWLSYGALDQILEKVADLSCASTARHFADVLILDPPTFQALQAYDSFYMQAEGINAAFADMAPKAGAGGGIDDFADITGAVTAVAVATTSETSSSFTIQDPTAATVLLGKLLKKKTTDACKSIYYGGVYELSSLGKPQKAVPSVAAELANLATTRAETLRSILGQPGAAINPKTCKGTATAVQGAPVGTTAVSSQDPCVSAFNNLDGTYNSFVTALSTPNSTTGQTSGDAAKQGYKLRALLETASSDTPMLGIYLSVAAAGGTQQDRKNLLTSIFTGDWIRYSGGVSVNVILFQIAGSKSEILFSDLVRLRTPLTKIKNPTNRKGLNDGDNLTAIPKELPIAASDPTQGTTQTASPAVPAPVNVAPHP